MPSFYDLWEVGMHSNSSWVYLGKEAEKDELICSPCDAECNIWNLVGLVCVFFKNINASFSDLWDVGMLWFYVRK